MTTEREQLELASPRAWSIYWGAGLDMATPIRHANCGGNVAWYMGDRGDSQLQLTLGAQEKANDFNAD